MIYGPQYLLDLYGDNTISWVPPVSNYLYAENISKRGINNRDFRWEEVTIDLTGVQSGAILDFLMPDYYLVQITPDLGWHDPLAMFGESADSSIHNPHLKNLGPYSISAGTLTNNADNSVSVTLTTGELQSAVIDGYPKYLWRAVPWADGNPGLGGLPSSFEWISSYDQLKFTVDTIKKETQKSTQVVSGTKGPRVTITIESDNNPTVFIEQTSTTWKVLFSIDRPHIKFTIIASDEGGTAFTKYFVDLKFDTQAQILSHAWNAFDSFALLASLDRLPNESNALLKERTIDAFKNKGGSHYNGLINGINRELGLKRKDSAITIKRKKNVFDSSFESKIQIETLYNRLSIWGSSFIVHDELQIIDPYDNSITLNNRIASILSINTESNQEIPLSKWKMFNGINAIDDNKLIIDPIYSGLLKITYQYKIDIKYSDYPTVIDVINKIKSVTNPNGYQILDAWIDATMTGSEKSRNLYNSYTIINDDANYTIGWSPIGLFSVSNDDFKWSFSSDDSMFFDSEFYKFVLELKSSTNIEWGFVVIDKDYWDTLDSNWYGRDSLPIALDIKLSKYVLAIPSSYHKSVFDSYEALRMNYYYDSNLLSNVGYPQIAFKSGVGFKKDCAVSFTVKSVNSTTTKINFNPIVIKNTDVIQYDNTINDIIVNL